jgi:SAM-dependent methyltransferase
MPSDLFRHIPPTFLPRRHLYWYARCKLASDPLYAGVGEALRGTSEPLLDLGCGIGLLAHTLSAQGFGADYRGCDNDADKIAAAIAAAETAGLRRASFACMDLAGATFPVHRGSVVLLDVLQFIAPDAASALIERAATCLSLDGRLVIRSGLQASSLRTYFTRVIDALSRRIGWMNATPQQYPRRTDLEAPLRGRLPFNNWLIVAERVAAAG